jgi:Putative DNA-binding domain
MKELCDWDEDYIKSLIQNRVPESLNLEFKACDALTNERWQTELVKDVSAFANSAGGTIVYGIKEDRKTHEAESIDEGYDPSRLNIERLEQIINSGIQRKIEEIRYKAVALNTIKPGRVLYVIHVPESSRAPHMANHYFYKRYECQSVPMDEYEVRERYRRETYPSRDIVCAWRDDVINRLIDVLKREGDLLLQETWTWRRHLKAFENLNAICESSKLSANEEDFLGRYPEIEKELKRHDEMLTSVNAESQKLFNELTQTTFLPHAYARASTPEALDSLKAENSDRFTGKDDAEFLAHLFGGKSDEERFAWLAELSINSVGSLDSSTIVAPFWNKNRESFIRLLVYPPLSASRSRVLQAREQLVQVIRDAITILKATRKELSERHGVPVEEPRRSLENLYSNVGLGYPRY